MMWTMNNERRTLITALQLGPQHKVHGENKMAKLTQKSRDEVRSLLEDHQNVTEALANVSKATWSSAVAINNEKDDSEYVSVGLDRNLAKQILIEQKALIERDLSTHGIEL